MSAEPSLSDIQSQIEALNETASSHCLDLEAFHTKFEHLKDQLNTTFGQYDAIKAYLRETQKREGELTRLVGELTRQFSAFLAGLSTNLGGTNETDKP